MRKIIVAVAFFLLTFFGLGLTRIEAQVTGCTGWICDVVIVDGNSYQTCTGIPVGCDDINGNPIAGIRCNPGFYVCNRLCCAIGTGSGGGGGL